MVRLAQKVDHTYLALFMLITLPLNLQGVLFSERVTKIILSLLVTEKNAYQKYSKLWNKEVASLP